MLCSFFRIFFLLLTRVVVVAQKTHRQAQEAVAEAAARTVAAQERVRGLAAQHGAMCARTTEAECALKARMRGLNDVEAMGSIHAAVKVLRRDLRSVGVAVAVASAMRGHEAIRGDTSGRVEATCRTFRR